MMTGIDDEVDLRRVQRAPRFPAVGAYDRDILGEIRSGMLGDDRPVSQRVLGVNEPKEGASTTSPS